MADAQDRRRRETTPVGKTEADQQRNALLLSEYDYSKYAEALTGFTGQDLQRIGFVQWQPAVRTRVGPRGNYKAGFTQLPDGKLVIAVCRESKDPDPTKRVFEIFVYESADDGLTWCEIAETHTPGKEASLAALPDGTLVMMVQMLMGGKSESHFARSEDGGRTWRRRSMTLRRIIPEVWWLKTMECCWQ